MDSFKIDKVDQSRKSNAEQRIDSSQNDCRRSANDSANLDFSKFIISRIIDLLGNIASQTTIDNDFQEIQW
jgi:hypothetical protein